MPEEEGVGGETLGDSGSQERCRETELMLSSTLTLLFSAGNRFTSSDGSAISITCASDSRALRLAILSTASILMAAGVSGARPDMTSPLDELERTTVRGC